MLIILHIASSEKSAIFVKSFVVNLSLIVNITVRNWKEFRTEVLDIQSILYRKVFQGNFLPQQH